MRCIHRDLKEQLEHYRYRTCVLWNFIMYRLTPPNRHHLTERQSEVENNKKANPQISEWKISLASVHFQSWKWRIYTFYMNLYKFMHMMNLYLQTFFSLTSCRSFFSLLFPLPPKEDFYPMIRSWRDKQNQIVASPTCCVFTGQVT